MIRRRPNLVAWTWRVGALGLVVTSALLVRRYDFETLSPQVKSLEGLVNPGALLILVRVEGETVLGAGSVVEAEVTLPAGAPPEVAGRSWRILSRIAAGPGDEIRFLPSEHGRVELVVNQARRWSTMDPAWQESIEPRDRIVEGPVPPGSYLLLDPAARRDGYDSRRVGLVPRARLRRKVITYF